MWQPAYVETWESGKLAAVAARLSEHYSECSLCPRRCGADRRSGDLGVCGADWKMKVSSAHAHFGEESPLVGRFGSGTIFFSHCSLRCVYCQNWRLSHGGEGTEVTDRELADMMLALEQQGCHNINFVTPSHYLPGILAALVIAAADGLRLPIVYNCGGYDCLEILRELDGIVDIYLPDAKYAASEYAAKYSNGAGDYPDRVREALREMHRQVGILQTDERGVARRGLMIRHLVLPHDIAGSEELMRFVAEELHPRTYVNIMSQYRPEYKAGRYPELSRGITAEEYAVALEWARKYGLERWE